MTTNVRARQLGLQLAAAGILLAAGRAAPASAWLSETPEEARRMADSLFQGKFSIDDANPEANVPSAAAREASPVDFGTWLMEVGERADRAQQRGDHAAAARYYAAIARAVPERAVAYSQLCRAHEAAKALDKALPACAEALRRDGATLADYLNYVRLVLAQPGELPARRVHDLDALLAHLQSQGVDPIRLAQLRCDVGVRLLDAGRLRVCSSELQRLAPGDPKTLSYAWALAVRERDADEASRIVESAKHSAMLPDAVAAMERATAELRPWARLRNWARAQLAWIAAALVLAASLAVYASRRPARQKASVTQP